MNQFKTQKSKKENCQRIIKSKIVTEEDNFFLLELLKSHPNYLNKKGVGIKKFFIQNTVYKQQGLYIQRINNSITDFSFYKCLRNPSKKDLIKRACRESIKNDIFKYKTKKNTHIHHNIISFNDIFNSWFEKNSSLDMTTNESIDNCEITFFKNHITTTSFRNFHKEKAFLVELDIQKHKELHMKK